MTENTKRFVIQQHQTQQGIHWDLMLENADKLQTYRLQTNPFEITTEPVTAEKIFDHRMKYLTYAGPISAGRGSTTPVASGTYMIKNTIADSIELQFNSKEFDKNLILNKKCDNIWTVYSV